MVMSPDRGGHLRRAAAARRGAASAAPVAAAGSTSRGSTTRDFVRAVQLLIERDDIAGAVNLAAPNPLPQRDFMRALRRGVGHADRAAGDAWMLEIGAFVLRTETELVLKSRRVVPGRLLEPASRSIPRLARRRARALRGYPDPGFATDSKRPATQPATPLAYQRDQRRSDGPHGSAVKMTR